MKSAVENTCSPSPPNFARRPCRPVAGLCAVGRLMATHLPDGPAGGGTTNTVLGGPANSTVPTGCICAGGWFTGVGSKFDRKSVSPQPAKQTQAASAARCGIVLVIAGALQRRARD